MTVKGEEEEGEGLESEGEWGGGDLVELKINVISAAAEKKQCLLLGEASLAACSRG